MLAIRDYAHVSAGVSAYMHMIMQRGKAGAMENASLMKPR